MEKSPFAKLSPELRNQIWQLIVSAPEAIPLEYLSCKAVNYISIVYTCRRIHQETQLMFYACNTFEIVIGTGDEQAKTGGYEEVDYHFRKSISRALQSLKNKCQETHAAVHRLQILLMMHPSDFERDLIARRKDYENFFANLRSLGYCSPRLIFVAGIFQRNLHRSSKMILADIEEQIIRILGKRIGCSLIADKREILCTRQQDEKIEPIGSKILITRGRCLAVLKIAYSVGVLMLLTAVLGSQSNVGRLHMQDTRLTR
ncbi:hypothetical protein M433DRAFT_176516 [Acidomyces richmondensis BFW]|nr:hypothetical protein M433DRAFT_176516 [Acidomyces richmondensis BFW]